jgi:hypothetical protein
VTRILPLAAVLVLLGRPAGATPGTSTSRLDGAAIDAALVALRGADLVVVADAAPGRGPSALVATRVAVAPAALAVTLGDPRAYREAIPALVRAEVVDRRHVAGATGDEQLVQWELEIPLFNLKGKAWVTPRADGVDLTLTEGDLAPGKLTFTWIAAASPDQAPATRTASGLILVLEAQANMRAAGWLFRRVASRSPFGESAMNLTAAYVVLRAAAERAQHPTEAIARRPRAAPVPPAPPVLVADAAALGESPAMEPFRKRGVVAAVRRAGSGRLGAATVAVPIPVPADALIQRLASCETWTAFPGWHTLKPLAGDRVEVDDNLPFVDFDATWQLRRDRRLGFSAIAVEGATRGALFAWDVRRVSNGDPRQSVAVLSLYPRLETAGYISRRFIAAEPLLEHGMALALAFVDAMSMGRALGNR